MTNNLPTIGEYNQVILHKGGAAFKTLTGLEFIPATTVPIRVFLFGSGAFAAVFKARLNDSYYAIRCFLSAENETINRYRINCHRLQQLNSSWLVKCELLEEELYINDNSYPIIKMDWIDGISIHKFVAKNINNKPILKILQRKLVAISKDLEENKIGHGDLQSGNIIVTENGNDFVVKLIDYDGMFVAGMPFFGSIEKGRSEFQHPARTLNDYNSKIDRFSFWVLITALEALRYDSSLWTTIVKGGFNTDDNFLFTIKDFLDPEQSALFAKLQNLNKPSLNYYVDKLKYFCSTEISMISAPELFEESTEHTAGEADLSAEAGHRPDSPVPRGKFRIICNSGSVPILYSNFQKIGNTPMDLDKDLYTGKTIILTNGKETKRVTLTADQSLIEIKFG